MIENIVGRKSEKEVLAKVYHSGRSEFVAVYGRRRVGKTFLVKEFFEGEILFQTSGLSHERMHRQIKSFYQDLIECGLPRRQSQEMPCDWLDIFGLLRELIKMSNRTRKIILLDELPWMDTPKSGFMSALEHFWNSWASGRRDIVLIVCGSATSWMMDKLINSHGGLHNRLTHQIYLQPFTLHETELLLQRKGFMFSRYDIAVCYMVMGGIPYYIDLLDRQLGLAQNIDQLLFRSNGRLRNEFSNLYAALFTHSDDYIAIVEALSTRRTGLTRAEIISHTSIGSGYQLTKMLRDLEACGFVRVYQNFEHLRKEAKIFQLMDFFTLFYFRFLKNENIKSWARVQGKTIFYNWAGLTFELLAMTHIEKIKQTLGISGVHTREFAWRSAAETQNAQIDLVIDRDDNVLNICEMKFSISTYHLSKEDEMGLRNKLARFVQLTGMKKSLQLTLISTYGLAQNSHSGIVTNEVTLDDLF